MSLVEHVHGHGTHVNALLVKARGQRGRVLDEHCAVIGRDPREIIRSTQTHVSYEDPANTRTIIKELVDVGVTHFALNLITPFPQGVARWLADEIIAPVLAEVSQRQRPKS